MGAEQDTVDVRGDRRQLSLEVGPISVVVTEIPGRRLTHAERRDVLLARRSYEAMWGGGGSDVVTNDPHDGFDDGPVEAHHYLAWVREGDGPARLLTMRKVSLVPSRMTVEQLVEPGELLPVDVGFWRAGDVPLWHVLKTHLRLLAPTEEWPEYRFASMGRIATYPFGEPKRTTRERERTAIAFAAIQLLATHGDRNLLHVWSLCPELRDKVLRVVDVAGGIVNPEFTPTEQTLGLPLGVVRMDNSLPVVREHKTRFPGFFIDNDDAGRLLGELLELGLVTLQDLAAAAVHLIENEEAALSRDRGQLGKLVDLLAHRDHRRFAMFLTRPRFMKYLIPLLSGAEPLRRMSTDEFRSRVLDGTRDGPFSATVAPELWAASARAMLAAAASKYAVDLPVGRPIEVRL